MEFEWDDEKARSNLQGHGVDFRDAAQIFAGPTVEYFDDREDYGEDRFKAYGLHDGTVYVVIYTVREDRIRVISAWKATRREREEYYQSVFG